MTRSIYLTTCARCGTHWLRRMIEHVTGLPWENGIFAGEGNYEQTVQNALALEAGGGSSWIYARHTPLGYLWPLSDAGIQIVVLVRDLRDVLISTVYWYMKRPHLAKTASWPAEYGVPNFEHFDPILRRLREVGHNMDWFDSYRLYRRLIPFTLVRYEDLVEFPLETLQRLFDCLGVDASYDQITEAIDANSFSVLSDGRKPGQEDIASHYRKGVIGDWKNYFSLEQNADFYGRFEWLLAMFGYHLNGERRPL